MAVGGKKTILLVEDEIPIAMKGKGDLEGSGYEVVMADSGERAIEEFRNNDRIDLVLMDIYLGGGIDGIDAAAAMLEEREVPIIFLSSHVESGTAAKIEKLTCYGYVAKSSGKAALDISISAALRLFETSEKNEIRIAGTDKDGKSATRERPEPAEAA